VVGQRTPTHPPEGENGPTHLSGLLSGRHAKPVLHACKPRASPERVTHLPHTRMATLTAGGVKAAHSGSDVPLCLKVCCFAPFPRKRSRKRCAGAVPGASGRQEALQVSAGKHRLSQNRKSNTQPAKQRRAVGRRGHRGRRAERRRLRSLPDRRRRRRAAADAVHRSDARRQDVRFPPSLRSSLHLRFRAAACSCAAARWPLCPPPSRLRPPPRKRAWTTPPPFRPPGAPRCSVPLLLFSLTNSAQPQRYAGCQRGACSPSRR
jgi:hypothetical protein